MSDVPGSAPAAPPQLRPPAARRIEILSPAVMRRFDDAGKWARGAGIAMIILGIFLAVVSAIALIAPNVAPDQTFITFGLAVIYLIPGSLMLVYGRRVDRALDEEASINIEMAMTDARRFWIALTLCLGVLTAIQVPLVLWPALKTALQESRMKKTAREMEPVRDALERYAGQYHSYPNVKSYSDLLHVLQPAYGHDLAQRAASGNALVYRVECADGYCPSYTLSADESVANRAVVVSNGRFIHGPKDWIGR